MAPQELFSQLSLCMVNLCLKSCTFYLFLLCIYICGSGSLSVLGLRIQIHDAPEYGSNTDPIRIQYGSGSTTLVLVATFLLS